MLGTPFSEGMRGAVSLTFDDGLCSHLARAVPLLDEHGLRGTFYLCPGAPDTLEGWKQAAASGHEIGNHTLSHLCSRAMFPEVRRGLEDVTLEEIGADIDEASRRLDGAFGRADRSFAYPCYLDYVGEAETRQSYVPVVAKRFIAARGKSPGAAINYPKTCVMHYLWSYGCERMSGAELVGLAMRAYAQQGWVIMTFHGVDEGHLPVPASSLAELCRFLRDHNPGVWAAPVIEVAKRVAEWHEGETGETV